MEHRPSSIVFGPKEELDLTLLEEISVINGSGGEDAAFHNISQFPGPASNPWNHLCQYGESAHSVEENIHDVFNQASRVEEDLYNDINQPPALSSNATVDNSRDPFLCLYTESVPSVEDGVLYPTSTVEHDVAIDNIQPSILNIIPEEEMAQVWATLEDEIPNLTELNSSDNIEQLDHHERFDLVNFINNGNEEGGPMSDIIGAHILLDSAAETNRQHPGSWEPLSAEVAANLDEIPEEEMVQILASLEDDISNLDEDGISSHNTEHRMSDAAAAQILLDLALGTNGPRLWEPLSAPEVFNEDSDNEDLLCGVCMSNKNDHRLECGHVLCGTCCAYLYNNTQNCPFCRRAISVAPVFI